jgi:hypothetical protein
MTMTSNDVRQKLTEALQLDLIGPGADSPLASETLLQSPSRWYLTGFLVPTDAGESQNHDEVDSEEVDRASEGKGTDDSITPDSGAANRSLFPSSIGISLLVPKEATSITLKANWGDYEPLYDVPLTGKEKPSQMPTPSGWRRTQRSELITLALPTSQKPQEHEIRGSDGLHVALSVRPVLDLPAYEGLQPKGTRSVSLFLVNRRDPTTSDILRDQAFAFQAELNVYSEVPLIPRPNLRGLESQDWDERVADLQYHDACEYAVGHGVSTHIHCDEHGDCNHVVTSWLPKSTVERVAPAEIPDVELGMEKLAAIEDGADASNRLLALVKHYGTWIEGQKQKHSQKLKRRQETVDDLLNLTNVVKNRIEAGIASLNDPTVLLAFKLANRVMARAARQRFATIRGKDPSQVDAPTWRPFQLAFILMNLKGIINPKDDDREVVDLLFFPTGGGKTEAYLGLAAFTLLLRRLKNPGIQSAGLSVLMRYTLRLLTLDQLDRASTLICALELERQQDVARLGTWPFEIGLWVGRAATPNVMGQRGDGSDKTARKRTMDYKSGSQKGSPVPIERCPWCGTKFTAESFRLIPNNDFPIDLRIVCTNRSCEFSKNNPLPILSVDEPIYRRLPCFLIATVDKFAAMPWTGEVGGFFGRVDRFDKQGFYGPCDSSHLPSLPEPLLPPDLIIQDELHLISGPMGTMVGLYEAALDELCSRTVDGKKIRPKIVASTATVRRARQQIRALFDRRDVDIFPPPGPDRRDSFFARVHKVEESPGRLYLGVAAPGRSLKVVLLRTYLVLMAAAQKWYNFNGGKRNPNNPADPYMTMLGYFNSLRELGGSRRIIEDEVSTRLNSYGTRMRHGEEEGLFCERKINYEVLELTSRVSTDKVADAKRLLALPFSEKDHVDVAIATNMISVGLDISRLGLMVVLGQPKMSAEYIQATSRVGRDVRGAPSDKPGLVVTILNLHRPRDRSHFERFACYHETFYRSVEATSVTPFSPRALDKGLAGALISLARQGYSEMTPALGAKEILKHRTRLGEVANTLAQRAERITADKSEGEALRIQVYQRCANLLDEWSKIAHDYENQGVTIQYQVEVGGAQRFMYEFLNPELKKQPTRFRKFRTNRSMRDVEPSVNLWLKTFDNIDVETESE